MPRGKTTYEKSCIYSVRSLSHPELVYIGSTSGDFKKRFSQHNSNYKQYLSAIAAGKKGKYISVYPILECGDAYPELVHMYPCRSKAELEAEEGRVIRSMDCVNKLVAGNGARWKDKNQTYKIRKEYEKKEREEAEPSEYSKYLDDRNARWEALKNKEGVTEDVKKAFWENEKPIEEEYMEEANEYGRLYTEAEQQYDLVMKELVEMVNPNCNAQLQLLVKRLKKENARLLAIHERQHQKINKLCDHVEMLIGMVKSQ